MIRTRKITLFSTIEAPFIDLDERLLSRFGTVRHVRKSGAAALASLLLHSARSHLLVSWFASTYAAILVFLSRVFRRQSWVIVGGADVVTDPALGYGMGQSRWKALLLRYTLRRASAVIPTSEYLRSRVVALVGSERKNLRPIAPGVDVRFWKPLGTKEISVLTIARCATPERLRVKGIDLLFDAARLIPEVPFVLIGLDENAAASAGLTAPENVTLHSPLAEIDLRPHYQRAKVYCQPSRLESFSFALAQGMLCGCVPVATRVGGMPEVIGSAGFLAEPNDSARLAEAIRQAIGAPAALGFSARERVASCYSLEARAAAFAALMPS